MQRRLAVISSILVVVIAGCGHRHTDTVGTGDGGTRGDAAVGDAAIGDASVDAGTKSCPAYTSLCNGTCIPTSNDPMNCGGCGIQCGVMGRPPNCSAGQCSATCLAPLTACSGSCVDTLSDNNNCSTNGTCGTACPANQGCNNGVCEPATVLQPPPGKCDNGGPQTDVGGMCSGNVAQTTFRWAICSCSSVDISNAFMTDGYNSAVGPYVPGSPVGGLGCANDGLPGQLGGGVGVNGAFSTSAIANIWGTLWSTGGIPLNAGVNAKQELHSGSQITGSTVVGDDGYVIGPFAGTGSFAKNLYAPTCPAPASYTVAGTCVANPAMTVPPPCDCSAGQLIDVAGLVAARATSNDNAQLTPPLNASMFAASGSSGRLDLPCGSYYLTNIAGGGGAVTIVAHGNTALYIGGDVTAGASLTFALDPGATFDVFISGAICDSNTLRVGSPNYPARMRIYVAGKSTCNVPGVTTPIYSVFLDNAVDFAGNVYAPYGQYFSGTDILQYGGIIAGSFVNTNNTCIHYDRAVLDAGCGTGTVGCTSCKDCNNQACINGTCGGCTDSSQCCSPLICNTTTHTCEAVIF